MLDLVRSRVRAFAGFPATKLSLGTSFRTTLPAPTTAFSPIETLGTTTAPAPSVTPLPILTLLATVTPGAILTKSSITQWCPIDALRLTKTCSPTKHAPPNATLQFMNVPPPILVDRETTAVGSISGFEAQSLSPAAELTKAIRLSELNAQDMYFASAPPFVANVAAMSSIKITLDLSKTLGCPPKLTEAIKLIPNLSIDSSISTTRGERQPKITIELITECLPEKTHGASYYQATTVPSLRISVAPTYTPSGSRIIA